MVNNRPRPRNVPLVSDRLCLFGCEEYYDLKKAVAEYKRNHANSKSSSRLTPALGYEQCP